MLRGEIKLQSNFFKAIKTKLRGKNLAEVPFFPYKAGSSCYILPKIPTTSETVVPPRHQWISRKYGNTTEEYLASGKKDLQQMCDILSKSDVDIESLGNILDFGCGNGRMTRWLEDLAKDREVWGTDINAGRVFWCKQNLNPLLRFLVTTTIPHLPFKDNHFGFVYAGSVFSHIDDLADTWFAELARVIRPGGKLFVTVHLKSDLPLLQDKYPNSGLSKNLRRFPEYEEFRNSDFNMFTIGRSSYSYVFYDLDFLVRSIKPFFRVLSVTKEVRVYQNALLLERVGGVDN